ERARGLCPQPIDGDIPRADRMHAVRTQVLGVFFEPGIQIRPTRKRVLSLYLIDDDIEFWQRSVCRRGMRNARQHWSATGIDERFHELNQLVFAPSRSRVLITPGVVGSVRNTDVLNVRIEFEHAVQALQCVAEVLPTNRRSEHDRLEPRVVFAHDALEGKLTECTSHGSLTDAVSEKEPTVLRPLVARTRNIMQGDFSQS